MLEILLVVVLVMVIIVITVKYWDIFKWVLLAIGGLVVWLGVALALLVWFTRTSSTSTSPWLLLVAALAWPILGWLVWDEYHKRKIQ